MPGKPGAGLGIGTGGLDRVVGKGQRLFAMKSLFIRVRAQGAPAELVLRSRLGVKVGMSKVQVKFKGSERRIWT